MNHVKGQFLQKCKLASGIRQTKPQRATTNNWPEGTSVTWWYSIQDSILVESGSIPALVPHLQKEIKKVIAYDFEVDQWSFGKNNVSIHWGAEKIKWIYAVYMHLYRTVAQEKMEAKE